ncbi:hypothetical protein BDF22DRAFT_443443 [Syncephalis plumigaleata]|nr:hypothetical protein BDF22DRAFT_443443 [Syncephalis plumigaleata]
MSSMTSTQGIPLTMTTSSTATPPPLVELSGLSKSPPRRSQSGAQTRRKRVFSTIKVVSEDEITDDAKAAGDNTILLTRMPSDPGEETSTSTSGRAKHPSIASVFGREALQLMEEKARNHSIITAQKARLGRGQHTQQSKSESALYSPNGTELDGSNGNDADSKASSSKSSMAQHDKSYSMHNRTVSLEEVVSAASTSTSASTSASSHITHSPGRNTDPLAVRHISPSKPLPAPSGLQREAQAPPVPPTRSASRQRAKGMDARRVQRATVLNATGGSNLGSGKGILDELQKHQKEQLNSVSPITRSAVANSLKIDDQMFQGVRLSRQSMLALAALKSPTRFHRMSSSNYYTADSASVSKPLDALTDPSTQRRTSRLSTLSRSRSVEIKDSRIITDVIAEADTALQLAKRRRNDV